MENELFRSRADAGRKLAEELRAERSGETVVLAVPAGGVLVGYEVSQFLECALDIIVPGKVPIPFNPETAFGAVTPDGSLVINEGMVRNLGLTEEDIESSTLQVRLMATVLDTEYREGRQRISLKDKLVILVDDGIASGYTMLAAMESVRRQSPSRVVVAVPVASSAAVRLLGAKADRFVALAISQRLPFAIPDFYIERSTPDAESVRRCLGGS